MWAKACSWVEIVWSAEFKSVVGKWMDDALKTKELLKRPVRFLTHPVLARGPTPARNAEGEIHKDLPRLEEQDDKVNTKTNPALIC